MVLTFRYRLLPTKLQHRALGAILEGQRQLYNAALEERIGAFQKAGITRAYVDQCKALTRWRREDAEAANFPVALQRWTLKRLDEAYQAFFRRLKSGAKAGFPRFRGQGRFNTFGFRQFSGITFREGRVRFRGMPGALRVHLHRPIPETGSIRSCVFHRDAKGWTVGLAIELPEARLRGGNRVVGVDLGISLFASISDGGCIPSLRAARRAERAMRLAQRALSRKQRGSKGRTAARHDLARCCARITRARSNHLHQASARLARDYEVIVVEKLQVNARAQGILAKDVRDASWGLFISMLRYKAECAGSRVIEVDPSGTSQECSDCGLSVPKTLSERQHVCGGCGLVMDRDLNAARNILHRAGVSPGLRNVATYGMRAGGNLDETVANVRSGFGCN